MTVANRAIGAPINIWNDHTDALSQRDFRLNCKSCRTSQGALDLQVEGFRLAELSLPIANIRLRRFHPDARLRASRYADARNRSIPTCRKYRPRQVLDPAEPVSISAMVPVGSLQAGALSRPCQADGNALKLIQAYAAEFKSVFGHAIPVAWCHTYKARPDAETMSRRHGVRCSGTIKDTVDEMRAAMQDRVPLGITLFRPFPIAQVRRGAAEARGAMVVLEKSLAVGLG
ncbi:MAG: pyruvate ferredoxin oxidoreductase, partial [Rhodocyclaceae bacterium]|nr:pyruvate ferredoxin oxidoreductase [Rhodocyclaceae bacterium]